MRSENRKRSVKMSSVLGTSLPPSRIYHKQKAEVRPTSPAETSAAAAATAAAAAATAATATAAATAAAATATAATDIYYSNSKLSHPSSSSPAGDNIDVESIVVEPSAPDVVHSKGDDVTVEEPTAVSPAVEDTPCVELTVPAAAEVGSVVDNAETFSGSLPLPDKTKKMTFVSPLKPTVPHHRTHKQSYVPPPTQTAAEELPRGVYVPPASSPYPTLDLDQETHIATERVKSEPETEIYPNPFKSSCSVLRLSGGLFEEFLKQMDVVLVMFYKGALGQKGTGESWSKEQFVKASKMTNRTNHAYAAVDCAKENSICSREEVTSFPLFRLYSKGHMIDTIKNYQSFDSEAMKKFVEYSPVLDQRPRTESLFSRIARSSTAVRALD